MSRFRKWIGVDIDLNELQIIIFRTLLLSYKQIILSNFTKCLMDIRVLDEMYATVIVLSQVTTVVQEVVQDKYETPAQNNNVSAV